MRHKKLVKLLFCILYDHDYDCITEVYILYLNHKWLIILFDVSRAFFELKHF